MPTWLIWLLAGAAAWVVLSIVAGLLVGRVLAESGPEELSHFDLTVESLPRPAPSAQPMRRRILIVDDDAALRLLLRTTFPADEFEVREAGTADEAAGIARFVQPEVAVLDVGLPGRSGLELAQQLQSERFGAPRVILLTGADTSAEQAREAGAHALLRKPFSPVDLVDLVDHLPDTGEDLVEAAHVGGEQLLVYARDVSRLLEIERRQRRLLQQRYRQATTALADALEARDPSTKHHALRVQLYALELADAVDPSLLEDPGLEYGFLLHDIGKIGIPDTILNKRGPLNEDEYAIVRQHPVTGAAILADVDVLRGNGIDVVRCHHERWDGNGYPEGLAGTDVPLAARIFSVADALDAMTSDRAYRRAWSWDKAIGEILSQTGAQFDPSVVASFARRESALRGIYRELMPAAA